MTVSEPNESRPIASEHEETSIGQRDAGRSVLEMFRTTFGGGTDRALLNAQVCGRTEIAGNHTDHQHGKVIAATIDRGLIGIAAANGTDVVRVVSEGFADVEMHTSHMRPEPDERVSTRGLVRGMLAGFAAQGVEVPGFDLYVSGNLPAGAGLSSSAAFELLVGCTVEQLCGIPHDALALAVQAQRAECEYFGKPCGIMDQATEALGGIVAMDLDDPGRPQVERVRFDLEAHGYALCLVDVGCDHSRYTDEYAAVSEDMFRVARLFGAQVLRDVDEAQLADSLPQARAQLGDRAVLRALHFYEEERLVDRRREALVAGDMDTFLAATRRSGASSAQFLQNVSCGGSDQPAMVALALAEHLLEGTGAVRIHGGGFGGSIQAYVPLERLEGFIAGMDRLLDEGCCQHLQVTDRGASCSWL